VAVLLSANWPDRTHYAPMDAAMLARYGIFRRLGMFGVEAGTLRGAAAFLRAGQAILTQAARCSGSPPRGASPMSASGPWCCGPAWATWRRT